MKIIESLWKDRLEEEFKKPYYLEIEHFLTTELSKGRIIYPNKNLIFNAYNSTPFDQV